MESEHRQPEDLMRDATALVDRIEFENPDWPCKIVVGFRRDGQVSFFFGEQPVYQFNDANEVRRAFWQGCLLKADEHQLVRLRRSANSELLRDLLDAAEFEEWRHEMLNRMRDLRDSIQEGTAFVSREVSEVGGTATRVAQWLDAWLDALSHREQLIAGRPNVTK